MLTKEYSNNIYSGKYQNSTFYSDCFINETTSTTTAMESGGQSAIDDFFHVSGAIRNS